LINGDDKYCQEEQCILSVQDLHLSKAAKLKGDCAIEIIRVEGTIVTESVDKRKRITPIGSQDVSSKKNGQEE